MEKIDEDGRRTNEDMWEETRVDFPKIARKKSIL